MSWKFDVLRSWPGAPKGKHRAEPGQQPEVIYTEVKLPLLSDPVAPTGADAADSKPQAPEPDALESLRLVETGAAEIRKTLETAPISGAQSPVPVDRLKHLIGQLRSLETQAQILREAVEEAPQDGWSNIPGGFQLRLNDEETLTVMLPRPEEVRSDWAVGLLPQPIARPTDWLGTLVEVRDLLPPAIHPPDVPDSIANPGPRIITLD